MCSPEIRPSKPLDEMRADAVGTLIKQGFAWDLVMDTWAKRDWTANVTSEPGRPDDQGVYNCVIIKYTHRGR